MSKHRGVVFAVVRRHNSYVGGSQPHLIGVYESLQRAEEIAGRSMQEFKDASVEGFVFEVQTTTYYSE